jgi:hypothetical protein
LALSTRQTFLTASSGGRGRWRSPPAPAPPRRTDGRHGIEESAHDRLHRPRAGNHHLVEHMDAFRLADNLGVVHGVIATDVPRKSS